MTPHERVRAEAEAMLKPGQRFALATDCQLRGEQPEFYAKRPHLRPPVLIGLALPHCSLVLEVPAVEYDAVRLFEWSRGRKEP